MIMTEPIHPLGSCLTSEVITWINGGQSHCDSWTHSFNYEDAGEAWDAAVYYYSEMPEVQVNDIRPSTRQEVIEFLDECYGPHENEDLPF